MTVPVKSIGVSLLACFVTFVLAYLFVISPLRAELLERNQDLVRCQDHADNVQIRYDELEVAQEKLQKYLNEEKENSERLSGSLQESERQYKALSVQFATLDSQCSSLDTRVMNLEGERSLQSTRLADCQQESETCSQNKTELASNASRLKSLLDLEAANLKKCMEANQEEFKAIEAMKHVLAQREHQLRVLNNENYLCFDRLEALERGKVNNVSNESKQDDTEVMDQQSQKENEEVEVSNASSILLEENEADSSIELAYELGENTTDMSTMLENTTDESSALDNEEEAPTTLEKQPETNDPYNAYIPVLSSDLEITTEVFEKEEQYLEQLLQNYHSTNSIEYDAE